MKGVLGLNTHQARFIVFDIETTGGNPEKNRITEIFAIRYFQGKIEDTFHSLVNPKIPVPRIVAKMTGLTNTILKDAPLIKEVMPSFLEFIGRDILVSHNTIGDLKFIRHFALETAGIDVRNFFLCTHLLVERLFPEAPKKSLGGAADFFQVKFQDSSLHRAEADAYLTLEVFKRLSAELQARGLNKVHECLRIQGDLETLLRIGWGIPPKKFHELPSRPGLLRFFGRDKREVFRTHSFNLKSEIRRMQYWQELPKNTLRALTQAYSYSFVEAEDAFDAALLEARSDDAEILSPAHIYHGRQVLCLNLIKEPQHVLLEYGPIKERAVFSSGPLGDIRHIKKYCHYLCDHFSGEENGRSVIFPSASYKKLVVALNGKEYETYQGLGGLLENIKGFVSQVLGRKKAMVAPSPSINIKGSHHHWQRPQWVLQDLTGILCVPHLKGINIYFIIKGLSHGKVNTELTREQLLQDVKLQGSLASKLGRYIRGSRKHMLTKTEAAEANFLMWMIVSRSGKKRSFYLPFDRVQKKFNIENFS